MNEIITQALAYIFKAIILALSGVVTFYIKTVLVPWLQDRQLYTTVQRYVQAAEKVASTNGEKGKWKKAYVVKLLLEKGIKVTPEIEALIESATEELDWMQGEVYTSIIGEPAAVGTDDSAEA